MKNTSSTRRRESLKKEIKRLSEGKKDKESGYIYALMKINDLNRGAYRYTVDREGQTYTYCIITGYEGKFNDLILNSRFIIHYELMHTNATMMVTSISNEAPEDVLEKFVFITETEFKKGVWKTDGIIKKLDKWNHMMYDGVPVKIDNHCVKYPYNDGFIGREVSKTVVLWGLQNICLQISGVDTHTKYIDIYDEDSTFITEEEYDRLTKEYMEKKYEEFGQVKERYSMFRYNNGYFDARKATVTKKYVYGENDLFVEFEERHMSDETNEVKTFTMEFNKFRNTYPLTENPEVDYDRD